MSNFPVRPNPQRGPSHLKATLPAPGTRLTRRPVPLRPVPLGAPWTLPLQPPPAATSFQIRPPTSLCPRRPADLRLAAPQGNPSSRLANPSSSPVPDPAAVSTSRGAASAVSAPATPVGSVPYSPAGCAYAIPPSNRHPSHLRAHMTPCRYLVPLAPALRAASMERVTAFPAPWLTPSVILRPTFHNLLSSPFIVCIDIHDALRHPSAPKMKFREDFNIVLAMPFSSPSARSCRSRCARRRVLGQDGHSPHPFIFPSAFGIIWYLATASNYPETPTSFTYAIADVYNAALGDINPSYFSPTTATQKIHSYKPSANSVRR
ncbi:hypothetical protein C8F04DRAFT_1258949 [Mycena alexandri]|uniref:Uncharacterized protein n=1 Tax=Mycena alexandri TaxID=1745969 RepID=A0AAD6SZY7_9AGAR|nr:hypothetical protein C8F04DRAFT_1258949 [Mycena alexandri]